MNLQMQLIFCLLGFFHVNFFIFICICLLLFTRSKLRSINTSIKLDEGVHSRAGHEVSAALQRQVGDAVVVLVAAVPEGQLQGQRERRRLVQLWPVFRRQSGD